MGVDDYWSNLGSKASCFIEYHGEYVWMLKGLDVLFLVSGVYGDACNIPVLVLFADSFMMGDVVGRYVTE